MEKAYLILSDGTVFEGERLGAAGSTVGELVFTTGMCGYLETLTDPSYAGQIVMQTFPLIGNYGVIPSDFEGESAVKGYVVRECCESPSNFRCEGGLDAWLRSKGIVAISGVDTRELTRIIREHGVMNAAISFSPEFDLSTLKDYSVRGVVAEVSSQTSKSFPATGEKKYNVVLLDYGAKDSIISNLTARGCQVTSVPYDTPAERVLALAPDGVMLSNGPGDPAENTECIAQLQKLAGKLPVFGICLGHQLLALAMGARTEKLKYGHRGANQPVSERFGSRTYITSQNHGYAVVSESLAGIGREIFVNANDGTCEGVEYPDKNCFSVQFHPEARSGPQDTSFLFDRFIDMMKGGK